MCIYFRLSGLSPFLGDDDNETLNNILACNWEFEEEEFQEVSEDAKDFISKLLIKEKWYSNPVVLCLSNEHLISSYCNTLDMFCHLHYQTQWQFQSLWLFVSSSQPRVATQTRVTGVMPAAPHTKNELIPMPGAPLLLPLGHPHTPLSAVGCRIKRLGTTDLCPSRLL